MSMRDWRGIWRRYGRFTLVETGLCFSTLSCWFAEPFSRCNNRPICTPSPLLFPQCLVLTRARRRLSCSSFRIAALVVIQAGRQHRAVPWHKIITQGKKGSVVSRSPALWISHLFQPFHLMQRTPTYAPVSALGKFPSLSYTYADPLIFAIPSRLHSLLRLPFQNNKQKQIPPG
jgi:hypothetical protein